MSLISGPICLKSTVVKSTVVKSTVVKSAVIKCAILHNAISKSAIGKSAISKRKTAAAFIAAAALMPPGVLAQSSALTQLSITEKQTDLVYTAWKQGKPSVVISHTLASFTLDDAYAIQRGFVARRLQNDSIRGYKGGLTSAQLQKQFGLNEPVVAVLFASGELASTPAKPAVVEMRQFHRLVLETEVGFVFDKPVTQPLASVDELRKLVRGVMPAVELPDIGFSDTAHLRGVDAVANNVSARQFIVGPQQSKDFLTGNNLSNVSVELRCNGRALSVGKAAEVMGSPWQAVGRGRGAAAPGAPRPRLA